MISAVHTDPGVDGALFSYLEKVIEYKFVFVFSFKAFTVFTLGRNMISLITNETCFVMKRSRSSHQAVLCANHDRNMIFLKLA